MHRHYFFHFSPDLQRRKLCFLGKELLLLLLS
jgi:hypothetical protein